MVSFSSGSASGPERDRGVDDLLAAWRGVGGPRRGAVPGALVLTPVSRAPGIALLECL